MSHSFEHDREDHRIHHMHIPSGHAHLDQKLHKAGRSPMTSQLPMANGEESPETAPGLGMGDANPAMGGGGM